MTNHELPLPGRALDAVCRHIVTCPVCTLPLHRTPAMIKRGTTMHAGSCANRARAWFRDDRAMAQHIRKMHTAARDSRARRVVSRMQRIAPHVSPEAALLVWNAGYKAGYSAQRRGIS